MGLVAPHHVGSSRIRDRTRVPCIGRWILNHCTTREVPGSESYSYYSTSANKRLKWAQDRREGTRENLSQNLVGSWSRLHVHYRVPWGKKPENPERETESMRLPVESMCSGRWWAVSGRTGWGPYLHFSWVLRKRVEGTTNTYINTWPLFNNFKISSQAGWPIKLYLHKSIATNHYR